MESERVRLVRRAYREFREGAIALELVHPEAEWDLTARVFNPHVYRGHEGVKQFVQDAMEVWDEWIVEPEQFFEHGDTVVAFIHARSRGRGSGVVVEDRTANLWRFRDGKVIGFKVCRDRAAALAEAGLTERAGEAP